MPQFSHTVRLKAPHFHRDAHGGSLNEGDAAAHLKNDDET